MDVKLVHFSYIFKTTLKNGRFSVEKTPKIQYITDIIHHSDSYQPDIWFST
mgnify:CR=1 FL=1